MKHTIMSQAGTVLEEQTTTQALENVLRWMNLAEEQFISANEEDIDPHCATLNLGTARYVLELVIKDLT